MTRCLESSLTKRPYNYDSFLHVHNDFESLKRFFSRIFRQLLTNLITLRQPTIINQSVTAASRLTVTLQVCDGRRDCPDEADEQRCRQHVDFDIRLVGGQVPSEGRIEVKGEGLPAGKRSGGGGVGVGGTNAFFV